MKPGQYIIDPAEFVDLVDEKCVAAWIASQIRDLGRTARFFAASSSARLIRALLVA